MVIPNHSFSSQPVASTLRTAPTLTVHHISSSTTTSVVTTSDGGGCRTPAASPRGSLSGSSSSGSSGGAGAAVAAGWMPLQIGCMSYLETRTMGPLMKEGGATCRVVVTTVTMAMAMATSWIGLASSTAMLLIPDACGGRRGPRRCGVGPMRRQRRPRWRPRGLRAVAAS